MNPQFDHEKLHVYQASLIFITWAAKLLSTVEARAAAKDQLDRASTSVPLNIAEGNGKFAVRDRCRFIEIARGSGLECAACLDVLVAKGLCDNTMVSEGKGQLLEIVSMLTGLQSSLMSRVSEESPEYLDPEEKEVIEIY
jgi:four helix bundle protein